MKRKLSFLSTMMLLMTCLVFNACSDSDDVAGGNLVDVLKNNKWQFEYVDDYNESQYGDYFYTYTYRLYFMDNNVGYHYTVEKEYESGSGYSQESYFDKFTYNVSGNTVEVRFKNGTDTYIYNGGFLALGDDIYTPSAMTQSDRDFVNRKAQEIDDEEENNEIVNNLDDYVSVSSKFIEEDLCIEFTLNTMLSEYYPDKSFEYGIEFGYGNYSYTSNLDMAGRNFSDFAIFVIFDECDLWMKSYNEIADKIKSGEELTGSERDYFEDIIDEIERKVRSFKARIFVALNDKRYYVYDDFYAHVELKNWASDDYEDEDDGQDDEEYGYDGAIRGHKYVDLGLPSGLKWATCNVGADEPWEYGDYFAWGETEPKDYYYWDSYKWCNGSYNTQTKYCTDSYYGTVDNKTVLDLADDAAYVNMGAEWRMPTRAELDELLNNCTWTWTTQNGVKGYKVTGKNGNSLFLPAAGYRYSSNLSYAGSFGNYWTSSLSVSESYSSNAYDLGFDSDIYTWYYYNRYYGQSVRAVVR